MLTIYTTPDHLADIQSAIASQPRLDELVSVVDFLTENPQPSALCLVVGKKGISFPVDWQNVMPPFLFSEQLPFHPDLLLGLVFAKLGNGERAAELLRNFPNVAADVVAFRQLMEGMAVNPDRLSSYNDEFDEYRLLHNQAILRHYASEGDIDVQKVAYFYEEALQAAPNDEHKAFTAKHYGSLFTDIGQLTAAENVLSDAIAYALSDDAKVELKYALCAVWMQQLTVPYDEALLAKLKETLWEVLQAYEAQGRSLDAALVLVDASQIANFSNSFSESLGYISRAVDIFRREEQPEMLASAQLRRGTLLYTWAKNGSPQFFKGAMDSLQDALKVFTREDAPETFAQIHHYLGVIYSEIPDEVKKKSIWASVSVASFNEALGFFTKESHPYEYAAVCNSYGNALTKYPDAIHSDNYEKALFYYQAALEIRTPAYPYERALTLLNYLEACWYANNGEDETNPERFHDMVVKALEVKHLVDDAVLVEEAERHLEKLEALRGLIA
jgi:tetratricopeptide (TPR) repeat protein